MSDSISLADQMPTPIITLDMIRWMEVLMERDKAMLRLEQNRTMEQQAMLSQYVAGRWSVLEDLKILYQNQRQKEAEDV